jgi:hypothetical protein
VGSDFGDASARGLSLPDLSRLFEADVFKKQDGRWVFVSHATSVPPPEASGPVRISEAGVDDMKIRFDAALAFEQLGRLREVEPLRRRIEPAQASASGGEGYLALAMAMWALAQTPALPEVMLAGSLSAKADIGSD